MHELEERVAGKVGLSRNGYSSLPAFCRVLSVERHSRDKWGFISVLREGANVCLFRQLEQGEWLLPSLPSLQQKPGKVIGSSRS